MGAYRPTTQEDVSHDCDVSYTPSCGHCSEGMVSEKHGAKSVSLKRALTPKAAAKVLRHSPGFSVREPTARSMPRPLSVPNIDRALKERQGS